MNCKNCGGQISGNQKFCPYCGSQIIGDVNNTPSPVNSNNGFNNMNNQNTNMNPYPMGQNMGGFNNLNNMNSPKKNPATVVLIMEFVFGIIMLCLIVFIVITTVSKKNNGGTNMNTIVCKKDGKRLDQVITLDYDGEVLKKYKVEYKIDSTVDEDSVSSSESSDLMMAAFAQMGFANYSDETGIEYDVKEDSKSIETIFSIDFDKASKNVADEIMSEEERLSYSEALSEFKSNGFTCTNK